MKPFELSRITLHVALALAALHGAAVAAVPADPASYDRKVGYVYSPTTGKVVAVVNEPSRPTLCSMQQIDYDGYGNPSTQELKPCATTEALVSFAARITATTFGTQPAQALVVDGASVSLSAPIGLFATSTLNPLSHWNAAQYDPRFGSPLRKTDANGVVATSNSDDFGRTVRDTSGDGTSVVQYHCFLPGATASLLSTNTPGCPDASAHAPPGAVRFTHTEPRNTADIKMGPFARAYYDGAGRELRKVTESFDGPSQPAALRGAPVVQDTVYSVTGQVRYTTAPYFVSSGSTRTSGSNDVAVTANEYDALGRVVSVWESRPGAAGTYSFGSGSFSYGQYGSRAAIQTRTEHSALLARRIDTDGRLTLTENNATGQVVRTTDPLGSQVSHRFDAFGNLLQSRDALQNLNNMQYDVLGRVALVEEPDRGVRVYCRDAIGQLKAEQNSTMRGGHTAARCPTVATTGITAPVVAGWMTQAYDVLGRQTQLVSPSMTITKTYDSGTGAIGKVSQVATSLGVTRKTVYDSLGRTRANRTDITAGPSWAESLSYDTATGRVSEVVYPTGLKLTNSFTPLGHAMAVSTVTALTINPLPAVAGGAVGNTVVLPANTALVTALVKSADGKSESTLFSNGLQTTRTADSAGRLTDLKLGTVGAPDSTVHLSYGWAPRGNLNSRTDHRADGAGAVTESFSHDELDRLVAFTVAGPAVSGFARTVNTSYNQLGMLQTKSDVGTYAYPAQGQGLNLPHAPTQVGDATLTYDLNGNALTASAGKYRTLSFNEFDKVTEAAGPAGGPVYTWAYDEGQSRIRETRVTAGGTRTTWYAGALEREVNDPADESKNRNRHAIRLGDVAAGTLITAGALPVLHVKATSPTALTAMTANRLEYAHKDMLGSVVATTDHAGALTARMAYEPFGARRNTGGNGDPQGALVIDWNPNLNHGTGVGFTGHEELDDIGLVNANARMYDDRAGVFLQADPVNTLPENTQNYAKYAYVLNNPLTLVDPTGLYPVKGSMFAEDDGPPCFDGRNQEHGCGFFNANRRFRQETTETRGKAAAQKAEAEKNNKSEATKEAEKKSKGTEPGILVQMVAAVRGAAAAVAAASQESMYGIKTDTNDIMESPDYSLEFKQGYAFQASGASALLQGVGGMTKASFLGIVKYKHSHFNIPDKPFLGPATGSNLFGQKHGFYESPLYTGVAEPTDGLFSLLPRAIPDGQISLFHGTKEFDMLSRYGFDPSRGPRYNGSIFLTPDFNQAASFSGGRFGGVLEFRMGVDQLNQLQNEGKLFMRQDRGYPYGPEVEFLWSDKLPRFLNDALITPKR